MKQMKKKSIWKAGSAALAGILTVAMLAGIFSNDKVALAAEKISDLDTTMKYTESLGNNASTEYSGRVWSDKSVYSDEKVNFELFGGENAEIINDSDFLVAFSTLATSEAVQGETTAPIDVVFVIDISGSMSNGASNMDNGYSRIYNTVQALNTSIDTVLNMNEHTRIGVVAFSSTSIELLPLDRYTKVDEDTDYFSLSESTGNDNNAILYTRAVDSDGTTVERDTSVSGGTNIQMGLYQGLNMLATEDSITATIDGTVVKRVPSLILLSDGSPTYSSNSRSWWAPANNNSDGPGSSFDGVYAGNGMKAIMTGAYMKGAADRNYGVAGTASKTRIYTVGMGITSLSGNERALADITLNPAEHWEDTDDISTEIREAWEDYEAGRSPQLPIDEGWWSSYEEFTFTHPSSNDVTSVSDYVDKYYNANDANSVANVFETIMASISLNTPQVPTEMKTDDPLTDGYITYVDPIGKHMEVKDVKEILYAGQEFKNPTKTISGNKTTYTFEGEVHSSVYGDQDISYIIIEVEKNSNGDETLTVKIPASVIPLRVNTVELNEDGSVKNHTNNGAYPTRVLYTVGLKEELITDEGIIDTEKLSADYIAENTNDDGTISFYSNLYTGTKVVNGSTAGDAYVSFDPAPTNSFYYMQEEKILYEDEELTIPASDPNGLDPDKLYYYSETHYHGNEVITDLTIRTGAQLTNNVTLEYENGHWQRPKGTPRINRVLEFEGTKSLNQTSTAQDFYAPTFVYAEDSTDPYEGHYEVYLGNNGILRAAASGAIEISKEVTAAYGLTAPDKDFTFTVNFNGDAELAGDYTYTVTANGTQVTTGTVVDGDAITLKAGQVARITGLPNGTTYTVTETAVPGFTTFVNGETTDTASGTISAGNTADAAFTNNYTVEEAVVSSFGAGSKVLNGRNWKDTDRFVFVLTADNPGTTPMPEQSEVTVTMADVQNGKAPFSFGDVTYTQPGVYEYTIDERVFELVGFRYSAAQYDVIVTVTDNGDGTLSAEAEMYMLVDHEGHQLFDAQNPYGVPVGEEGAVFINTYNAQETAYGQVVHKNYVDRTEGSHSLTSGMFEFKLEAVGDAPMPAGVEGNVLYAHNVGDTAIFDQITYTQDMDGKSFEYKISEVIPKGAVDNGDGTYSFQGMTYDGSVHTTRIDVSLDESTGEAHVKINVYYDGQPTNQDTGDWFVSFTNEYQPTPATAAFSGTKKLVGRDMLDGEAFEFVLMPGNAATNLATRTGALLMGNTATTVAGGKDGEAVAFTFEDVTFTRPGTYVFNITETEGNAGGVTYDAHTATVTVTVTDNNGVLTATPVYSEPDFTNTYEATFDSSTAVNLVGTKDLTGQTLEENEFYFNVTDVAAGTSALHPNKADGSVTLLENVTYTEAGTYVYMIQEQIPASRRGGMTYDESIFRYTVTVTDDLAGRLYVSATKLEISEDAGATYTEVTTPVFDNDYVPTPIATNIPVMRKVLAGYRAEALKANEFEFKLELVSADPAEGIVLPAATVVGNAADGTIKFDALTFKKAGTYAVKITEVVPEDAAKVPGVTYSDQEITVTYVVTDDQNGTLTANLQDVTGGSVFTNTYESEDTLVIPVTKAFTGRENDAWLDTDSFEFELLVVDETTKAEVEAGNILLPADAGSITIKHDTAEKTASFGAITFKKAGTYSFRVHEKPGTIKGVTYDTAPRDVQVVVTDHSDGTMDAVQTSVTGGTLTFANRYEHGTTVLTGHENLPVIKNFTGRADDQWLDTDEFTFVLEAGDDATAAAITAGKVVLPTETTLTLTKANKDHAHFEDITFKDGGFYRFKVTEVVPAGAVANEDGTYTFEGITYDAAPRYVEAAVVDNNDGTLSVTLTNQSQELVFNNTYKAVPAVLSGQTNLEVAKTLTGRAWKDSDVFTFTLDAFNGTAAAVEAGKVVLPTKTEITISGTDADKKAHFGDITFNTTGIYEFVIQETAGDIASVKYDAHITYVTVTVTDNNEGALVATASYAGSREFVNEYTTAGTVGIEVTKDFTGRTDNVWLASDYFRFHLAVDSADAATVDAAADGNVILPAETIISVTNGHANRTNTFADITIKKAGTYKFIVHELLGNIAGVTYDQDVRNVTVTAVDDGDGTMTITYVVENNESLTFSNVYNRQPAILVGATDLVVTKEFTGRVNDEWREGDQFTFALAGGDEATNAAIAADKIVMPEATLVIDKNTQPRANFGNITFKAPGNYVFTITEQASGIVGVTDDAKPVRTVYVTVVDNNDGTMTVTKTAQSDSLAYKNTYDVQQKEVSFEVTKELTGRTPDGWLDTDEFTFVLSIEDKATKAAVEAGKIVMPANATGITAKKDAQTVAFDAIQIKKAGTYKFVIQEQDGKIPGITYDLAKRAITVTATDNADGTMTVSYEIADNKTLTFSNEYDTEPANLIGAADLVVTKVFTGRTPEGWLDTDAFTFVLAGGNDETNAAIASGDVALPTNAAGITATKDHTSVAFGDITFKEPGDYVFTVTEQASGIAGVTDDAKPERIVKVTVTDNTDGTMTVAKVDAQPNDLTFTNVYKTQEVVLSGDTYLKVTKALTGRDWFDDDAFTFTLTAVGETANAVGTDVILPAETTITMTKADNAEKAFGDITFKKPGIYKFAISETKGALSNVAYDEHGVEVTVTVTDDTEGHLVTAAPTYTGSMTFENVYTPSPVEATLQGSKVMSGRPLKATDTFSFQIAKAEGSAEDTPMPAVTTVTNNEAGVVQFATMTYTKAGTYKYLITEVEGAIAGVTYDKGTVEATVEVTYDPATGILTPNVSYMKVGGAAGEGFVFTNTYKAANSDEVTFAAVKTVTPSEGNAYSMVGGEFSFAITPAEANPESDPVSAATKTNDANGNVAFTSAAYTEAGTYVYTVNEVSGEVPGISYDDAVYTITVVVTDNQETAKLERTVTITKGNETVNVITFNNGYDPTEATAVISGQKVLTGDHKELEAGEFTFKLSAIDGAPMPADDKAQNAATGIFNFGTITYDKVGVYEYEITEVNEGKAGYTYDGRVHKVTVTVTDEDAVLKAEVSSAAEVVFTNNYEPAEANVTITGKKVLDGRPVNEKEFTFVLKNASGETVDEADNAKDGSFVFDQLRFGKAGTYAYTIVEKNTNVNGVTYDTNSYAVTIEVTDKGGYLEAATTYYDDNVVVDAVVFNNTYKAAATSVQLSAIKKIAGRDLAAEEFEFVLVDEDGNKIYAKNDETGVVLFEEMTYTEAGTYVYTLSEVEGTISGVTYDETEYQVTVTVEDQLNGYLKATVAYATDGEAAEVLEFNNTYKAAPISVQISALKKLTGRDLVEGEFEFVLEDEAGNKYYAKNGKDGAILFDAIEYTEAGTYVYTLSEVAGTLEHVTYDDQVYTVVVVVEDQFDGTFSATVSGEGEAFTFSNTYEAPVVEVPTGDSTSTAVFAMMMAAAVGTMGTALYVRRKKEQ